MKMNALVTSSAKLYKYPVIKKIARVLVLFCGADITTHVKIGNNVQFPHNSVGTVIAPCTVIEDDVIIFQCVTIGYAGSGPPPESLKGFIIKKGAVLCAGSKILSKGELIVVGENTLIGANSVLTRTTGDNEIWVGIPARKVGERRPQ